MIRQTSAGVQLTEWLRRSNTRKCDFAATLGITRAFLSQLLHGHRRANLETLGRIMEITGIPIRAWVDTGVSTVRNQKKVNARSDELATR